MNHVDDVILHEIDGEGGASVGRAKRFIAVVAALTVAIALLVVLGAISLAVIETGDGSDPDRAFSPTQNVPGALIAGIEWEPDADDLVRVMEPSTRDLLGVMWLRADGALERAAAGMLDGLEVWFVDAALEAATSRFVEGEADGVEVGVAPATSHRLRVDFYSLDGAIVVLDVATVRLRSDAAGGKEPVEEIEHVEVIAVLSDGNWRIRHLERLTWPTSEELKET